VLERCEALVEAELATATDAEREAIVSSAEQLLARLGEVSQPA
jgi:hypothetical protein